MANDIKRRDRFRSAVVENFDPLDVFDRDDYVCSLCSEPIDRRLKWPDPLSVSLDHIVPIAHGGDHTTANCAAAHLVCNIRKGARFASP